MTAFTPDTAAEFIRDSPFIVPDQCALLLCNVNPNENDQYHPPEKYYHWCRQVEALITSGLLGRTSTEWIATKDTLIHLPDFIQCVVDSHWVMPDAFKDAAVQQYGIPFSLIGRDRQQPTDTELVYLQLIRKSEDATILLEGMVHFMDRHSAPEVITDHFTDTGITNEKAKVFRYIVEDIQKSQ